MESSDFFTFGNTEFCYKIKDLKKSFGRIKR